jgi:hypothetical protein
MATEDGPLAAERIPTGGNQKPDSRSNKRSRIPPPKAPPTILISANLDSSLSSQGPSAHTSDWTGIQSCPPKLSSPVERHVASNLCPSFHTSFGFNYNTGSVASRREAYATYSQQLEMPTPVDMSGARSPLLSLTGRQVMPVSSPRHERGLSESESSSDEHVGSLSYAYKRTEEPPRNHEAKIICKHQECTGLVFDRKYEWR